MTSADTILSVIALLVALTPLFLYVVARYYHSPKVIIKLGGEKVDTRVRVPSGGGSVWLGISTRSAHEVIINEVSVLAKDLRAKLVGPATTSFDKEFPIGLRFSGAWLTRNNYFKLLTFGCGVKEGTTEFPLKFVVLAKVDESTIGFPWDLIPPKSTRFEFTREFVVETPPQDDGERLKRYGFRLEPGQAIMVGETVERRQS